VTWPDPTDVGEVYQPAEDSRLVAETVLGYLDGDERVLDVGTGSGYVGRRVAEAVQRITPEFAGKPLDRSGLSTDAIGEMAVEALKAAATD
jgi:hypothetical protein